MARQKHNNFFRPEDNFSATITLHPFPPLGLLLQLHRGEQRTCIQPEDWCVHPRSHHNGDLLPQRYTIIHTHCQQSARFLLRPCTTARRGTCLVMSFPLYLWHVMSRKFQEFLAVLINLIIWAYWNLHHSGHQRFCGLTDKIILIGNQFREISKYARILQTESG